MIVTFFFESSKLLALLSTVVRTADMSLATVEAGEKRTLGASQDFD